MNPVYAALRERNSIAHVLARHVEGATHMAEGYTRARARFYKEDFQAVDIETIAKPATKWAVTVREPARVPRVFQQAFHLMRSARPGPVLIDLPFDIDTYEPLSVSLR